MKMLNRAEIRLMTLLKIRPEREPFMLSPTNLPTSRNVAISGSMTTWKGMIMEEMNTM